MHFFCSFYLEQDITDKWPIQPEHLIATFIHPRLRDFSGNNSLKRKAFDALQSAVSSYTGTSTNSSESLLLSHDPPTSSNTINLLSLCYDKP